MTLHLIEHPLVAHYLTRLRDRDTPPDQFREFSDRIITLLLYEATRDLRSRIFPIQTPLEETDGHTIADRVVAVPILRAGLGLLGPVLELLPEVTVGYIGLERDERTAVASRYYVKLPPDIRGKAVMLLDPMLATGGTARNAVEILKEYQPASVRLVCVVAAPEGIAALEEAYPDVMVFAAARDRQLNGQKYILPGLGDYGDRLFGT
ncbi:MAG TPA: uracil phosphoribosyltransferase [Candidatus Dormibacteraeota bacterium]|jgi:uracil phosphoribosyltransferase